MLLKLQKSVVVVLAYGRRNQKSCGLKTYYVPGILLVYLTATISCL